MWKWIVATLIFGLIVLELVFFAPQAGDRKTGKDWKDSADQAAVEKDVEQVLSGIHLVEGKGEKKSWELDSDQATKKKNSEDWHLETVKVKFFGENSVSYVANGDEGYVGDNQKKLKIEGDVVITSSNGYVLNTEVIFYKAKDRTIDGPKPVKLKGPPDRNGDGGPLFMESDTFDASLETNIINLKKNVRGRKRMSGGRKMKIRSRKAIFSGQSNYALFREDVVINVDDMTITGPRAKFIYKDNELYSMLIDGGVKIKDITRWGVAGEAEVFFQEDKYIFRDNPKVVEGPDQLVGDIIIVYNGGDRIEVKKAKTRYNSNSAKERDY
jgi:LPS export ABC transporter protein LptC